MVGPVVGAVALMVVPVVVMVLAVMVMLAVGMTGRVVGAMLGDGASGTANGERQSDGERCGYTRYRLHFCLLMNEFGRDPKSRAACSGHTHTHLQRFRTARRNMVGR